MRGHGWVGMGGAPKPRPHVSDHMFDVGLSVAESSPVPEDEDDPDEVLPELVPLPPPSPPENEPVELPELPQPAYTAPRRGSAASSQGNFVFIRLMVGSVLLRSHYIRLAP